MTDYQKYINALRKCAKEHENDRTSIGHIIVSDLCRDTANLLEALEQEPTTKNDLEVDCISRKAALDITWHDPSYSDPLNVLTEVRDKIRELPSVTPQPCEDAVSRQAVLELIADYDLSMGQVVRGIHALPSVTPQEPRKGHWDIKDKKWWVCSACGCQTRMMKKYNVPNFCPACGAKMAETEDT